MNDTRNRSLPEALAERLGELAARSTAAAQERSMQLLARREELRSLATGTQPSLDALAARLAELEAQVAVRRSEAEALEERLRALGGQERQLADDLAQSFAQLCERCEELIRSLPLLETTALHGWLAWLEDWHRQSQRPFEPTPDWRRHFEVRSTVAGGMALVEPVLDLIERLDAGDGDMRLGLAAVPAEIERIQAELHELEQTLAARLDAVAPVYGRIVQDLPDPQGADSLAKLERIEALLLYLEGNLGRFAASAGVERQMLEALA